METELEHGTGEHSGGSPCSTFEGWMAVMGYNTCTSDTQIHLREAWEAGQDPLHRKYAWLESDLSVANEIIRDLYLVAHEYKRQHERCFIEPKCAKALDNAFERAAVYLSNVRDHRRSPVARQMPGA